jgi:hypothetical protein
MAAAKNLVGLRFGALVVQKRVQRIGRNGAWLCACDCGRPEIVCTYPLTSGARKSCGCIMPKLVPGPGKRTHGQAGTHLHGLWLSIKHRCRCKSGNAYPTYAARGISYAPEWETFYNFYAWAVENGYERGARLRRMDLIGDYGPQNCYWEPWKPRDPKRGERAAGAAEPLTGTG